MIEFYVGQKVHCKFNGHGVVTARGKAYENYPIKVKFDSGYYESYTRGGKLFKDNHEACLTSGEGEVMPKDFYVGQEVCCKRNGKGVVVEIQESKVYPILVKFHNGEYVSYTADGKEYHRNLETDLTPAQENPTFTVGQQVWCLVFGEGVVSHLTDGPFVVKVKFLNGEEESYTSTGHLFLSEGNQTLFTYPVKVSRDDKATKPSIDWTHVNEKFKWLAVDERGGAYVYENKPKIGVANFWCDLKGEFNQVNGLASYVPGTCYWKDSLVERPQGH